MYAGQLNVNEEAFLLPGLLEELLCLDIPAPPCQLPGRPLLPPLLPDLLRPPTSAGLEPGGGHCPYRLPLPPPLDVCPCWLPASPCLPPLTDL